MRANKTQALENMQICTLLTLPFRKIKTTFALLTATKKFDVFAYL